ncbi:MAG: flagellar hook-associated protein FlgK [Oligoflexia bacterium]|nr:flagellar hook-associated protein FlgK [Oligoflexia bacterium]
MGIPNVFRTGVSGMMAAKTAVATTGHNIANANTEGYARQRVELETMPATDSIGKGRVGNGVKVSRIDRINDEYIEKQIRNSGRDLAHFEEKDLVLRQTEDIFNEMNGEGLNRLISRFFNEFRKLANEPENEAVRQSVREASQAMVNDFHRLRGEVEDVRKHIDARIEGYTREVNSLSEEVKGLNIKIRAAELGGVSAPDLQDKRDVALKKLASYMDLATHKDNQGNYIVDVRGVGPLVVGPEVQTFSVQRSPADGEGKPEGAFDLKTSASANSTVTHQVKGGRIGALLEARDRTLSTVLDRLDELAFTLSEMVNSVHETGFTRHGRQGVTFFKPIDFQHRAAEFLELSDEVQASVNNIATAAQPHAPGDNRIAIAISALQSHPFMNEGKANFDDFFNSIMSDVGVAAARNRNGIQQQRDIMTQLGKMRDQISGVSIDEETTNLMQFQHTYDASAKVIQVADEMLKTVLELKR